MVVEKLLDPILIEILRDQLTAHHPVPNMGEAPEIGLGCGGGILLRVEILLKRVYVRNKWTGAELLPALRRKPIRSGHYGLLK
jgi:hypothetical protein